MLSKVEIQPICNLLRAGVSQISISDTLGVELGRVKYTASLPKVKILLEADYHSGHVVGLTPPAYQYQTVDTGVAQHNKWARLQKEIWDWRLSLIDSLKPIDIHILNGDAVDGPGKRSGGTEELTTDVLKQCDMAVEALKVSDAGKYFLIYGTAYHAGEENDFESIVAKAVGAKIGSHDWLEFNSCVIDLKHHQSNTKNPFTSLLNEVGMNREWASVDEQPYANLIIRSHTHRFAMCQGEDWTAISTPALQGYGSKYGARRCVQKIHVGLISIIIWPDGYPVITPFIAKLPSQHTSTD